MAEPKLKPLPLPLYGLVLAGGRSTRMQTDKGSLEYHGVSQRVFCSRLLAGVCETVFVSCRTEQAATLEAELVPLFDSVEHLGPAAGILAALQHAPQAAWLVVACDMPYLSRESVAYLVQHRNAGAVATAYVNPDTQKPEPLFAIWESKSLPLLSEQLRTSNASPQQFLMTAPTHLITPPQPDVLTNVNTPDEHQQAIAKLHSKSAS